MAKALNIVTPIGRAVFPKLTKRDTEGQFASNKYQTYLALEPEDLKKIQSQIKAAMADMTFKVKQPALPFKDGKDGEVLLVAKSKYLPLIIDSKKQPLVSPDQFDESNLDDVRKLAAKNPPGGSRIRIGATLFNYDKGVSLQMHTVQVIEMAGRSLDAFDIEDGFELSEDESSNDEANNLDL